MSDLYIEVPLDAQARREWIKYQLRARGSSLVAITRDLGIKRTNGPIALVRPYPRMQRAIAKRLGLRPHQLWPEWYFPDDTRRRRGKGAPPERAVKNNSDGKRHNVYGKEAA